MAPILVRQWIELLFLISSKKVNCERTTVSKVGCLFESTFASLQGFLVATVYCLFSKDVGMEVKNYLKKAQGEQWLIFEVIGFILSRHSSLKPS